MRCAIYARYSSDRQSPTSIDDQVRSCRDFAERNGWNVSDANIYSDRELSGAGADRPGWVKLLAATELRPLPFDVILVDDTSRLSRNLGEIVRFTENMKFVGIRVVAVAQGVDTENEQADVLWTVHGLVDSYFLREVAQKTKRGLIGCVESGLHTGGRCFGYENVPVEDGVVRRAGDSRPVRLAVNKAEAEVVRRIFQMAADGTSLKGITKALNAEGIAPPRRREGRTIATWCPSAIREMLRRDLYRGVVIWNRSQFVKRPGTNKRVRRDRPESEWRIQDHPELRIIDEELWGRVQDRIKYTAEHHNFGRGPGLMPASLSSPHLWSGLLKCGVCGSNLVIVYGGGKVGNPRYGCPQNFNRGACSNGVRITAKLLDERLWSTLHGTVLSADAIESALAEFERQLHSALSSLTDRIAELRKRNDEVEVELRNLVQLSAKCGHSPAIIEGINALEQERKAITRQLLSTDKDSLSDHIARVRAFAAGQLGNLQRMAAKDRTKAKLELRKHLSAIRMEPQPVDGKGYYVAEGAWDLLAGFDSGPGKEGEARLLVAGVGFEPTTFGL